MSRRIGIAWASLFLVLITSCGSSGNGAGGSATTSRPTTTPPSSAAPTVSVATTTRWGSPSDASARDLEERLLTRDHLPSGVGLGTPRSEPLGFEDLEDLKRDFFGTTEEPGASCVDTLSDLPAPAATAAVSLETEDGSSQAAGAQTAISFAADAQDPIAEYFDCRREHALEGGETFPPSPDLGGPTFVAQYPSPQDPAQEAYSIGWMPQADTLVTLYCEPPITAAQCTSMADAADKRFE